MLEEDLVVLVGEVEGAGAGDQEGFRKLDFRREINELT